MKIKVLAGSAMAVGLMGLGVLAGSIAGSGGALAQTGTGSAASAAQVAAAPQTAAIAQVATGSQLATAPQTAAIAQVANIQAATAAQAATTPTPGTTPAASASPEKGSSGSSSITAKLTQQQAEQAALAASAGSTVDHSSLQNQNGTPVYDVDFTNGGGVQVNGDTGAVITVEAAGQDQGGKGGRGGHDGGANQAALAAQAKVTQQQAEQAALAASPGNTVGHSRLQKDQSGTIVWDVDFSNGGGAIVNAQTGAIVKSEAAGQDQGGRQQAPAATPTP